MATKKTTSKGRGGLGMLAAGVALVAGGYFLYGKDGAKHRKQVRGWMLKAKGEVLHEIENIKKMDLSEDDYNAIVDKVVKRYRNMKEVNAAETAELATELRGYWKEIKKRGTSSSAQKKPKPKSKSKAKTKTKKAPQKPVAKVVRTTKKKTKK